jgi:preprotein translocase subunit SecG
MEVLITVLCSVMIVMAIFLVIAVLMQSGKDSQLSGTIAGGAETFFGKTKGKTIDRVLSKATTIVSIIFVILVLLVYVLGATTEKKNTNSSSSNQSNQQQTQSVTEEKKEETETEEEIVTLEAEETATAEN